MYFDYYDQINAELRELAKEPEQSPDRLYVGSGEDFDVSRTFGAPNHLFVEAAS